MQKMQLTSAQRTSRIDVAGTDSWVVQPLEQCLVVVSLGVLGVLGVLGGRIAQRVILRAIARIRKHERCARGLCRSMRLGEKDLASLQSKNPGIRNAAQTTQRGQTMTPGIGEAGKTRAAT